MKKNLLILFGALVFAACNQKGPSVLTINGTIEGENIANIYLYKVDNQHYKFISLIETIAVNNGQFTYLNDSLQTNLYFMSTEDNRQNYDAADKGSFLFLRKGNNDMTVSIDAKKNMRVEIKDFPLQKQLLDFNDEKQQISEIPVLDSLNTLFYAAREKEGMDEELRRIKEETMPYYDEISKKEKNLIAAKIEDNKTSLFGLYLFYTYRFQSNTYSTVEEISEVRELLNNFDEEAKHSFFYDEINKKLNVLENCSVGHEAPEIWGLDTLNNRLSLSNFRGKYVLVDFWSSGCSWCRYETPNFQKTYDEFKDKNLVILGVSSDFRKEDWMKAIHEDKSYWTQIMMQKEEMNNIFESYAIVGIPQIMLIDPQGIILAKELRGDDIYNTVAKYVK